MNSELSRKRAGILSRRGFLSSAALASLGTLIGPNSSSGQVIELLSSIGLDVGKKLLDKAIDYALGGSLGDLFKEPTFTDVHQWINQSVTVLEKKIDALSAKIDAQNLYLMQAQLNSVRSMFGDFVSLDPLAKSGYKDILIQCEAKSSELLSLSQKYDQAFFLSTVAVAYRLLTRYALYQLDQQDGKNGQGHIVSLASGGEIQAYFLSAAQSRSRLVSSLAPQYAAECTISPGGFHDDTFECSIYRHATIVGKTATTKLSSYEKWWDKLSDAAGNYLDHSTLLENDVNTWRTVDRKSGEQIAIADRCMRQMYYSATGRPCPPLFDPKLLTLENTSTLKYSTGHGWTMIPRAYDP